MILDVARCYLWLFTLYINIKICKKWLLNVRLACDHLFGKLLFTWLSLVMSMMVSFVLSFFPRDVLDEILNLIESVSEDFPSYSCEVSLLLYTGFSLHKVHRVQLLIYGCVLE